MKYLFFVYCIPMLLISQFVHAQTWDEWFKQKKTQIKYLEQQIAKLQIYIEDLKKGYDIVHNGLNVIGDIKNGDFNLHSDHFNKLKEVSQRVKQSAKIAAIIAMQVEMANSVPKFIKQFHETSMFKDDEIAYFNKVFDAVINDVSTDIESLINVVTDNKMQMDDHERLQVIDKIYQEVTSKYTFIFSFGQEVQVNAAQRKFEFRDIDRVRKYY